jgi:hypothetical protein
VTVTVCALFHRVTVYYYVWLGSLPPYTVPPQVEVGSLHIFVSHFVVNLPTAMESPLDPKQYAGAYFNDSQN